MRMTFLVVKGDTTYDMTNLVESVKWGGKKSSAPRSLEVTMLDSDSAEHDRPDINIQDGQLCSFYWDGKELFRGMFIRAKGGSERKATFKAYDNAFYLAKNTDTFVYKKKTATQIFADVCDRFNLDHSEVDSGFVITDLTMPNTTCIDAIWAGLAKTYRATGKRLYVLSQKGVLKLINRADNVVQWVIEEGANAIKYSREESIEDSYTRVVLYSDANKVLATAADEAIEAKLGIMQHTEEADSKEKKAVLQEMCDTLLAEKKKATEVFSVETLGIPDVYSGVAIYINIPYLGIRQTYFVDEDTHTFKGDVHTMSLKLNAVADVQGAEDYQDE